MPCITFWTKIYFIISIFNIWYRSALSFLSLEHSAASTSCFSYICWGGVLQNRGGLADSLLNWSKQRPGLLCRKEIHIRDSKFGSKLAGDFTLGSIVSCRDTKQSLGAAVLWVLISSLPFCVQAAKLLSVLILTCLTLAWGFLQGVHYVICTCPKDL